MKSKQAKQVKAKKTVTREAWLDSDELLLPPTEETDATTRLLDRLQSRARGVETSPYFTDDLDEHDFLSEEALHRVVEDLQFGHETRL